MRSLFRRERDDYELDDELRFHIERAIAENIAAGMSRETAREAALREFGGVDQIREECADMRKVNGFQDLAQDIRYGLRMLRKSPAFTTVAVLTLALGIGANTAIFSIVYAVLLKPLPYPHPHQLVSVTMAEPQEGIPSNGTSYDNFREWRAQNHVFTEIGAFQSHELTLTGRGEPLPIESAVVTPGLFAVLGTQPIIGRTLIPEDGNQGAPPVVVLNENLWRDRFGADPNVLGTSITLDKKAYAIIGVVPASFRYPPLDSSEHVWIPLQQDPVFGPWMDRTGGHWLRVVARIKPGVSLARAQAEMDAIGARLAAKFPTENTGWVIRLVPLHEQMVGSVKTALLVLLGCVGLVLLIACANVSNLLLARATSRTKEMALRAALGAGRARIIRQLLTESAVLALVGGGSGVLLAYGGIRGLTSMLPATLPKTNAIQVGGTVLTFALVLSMLSAILFGLAPSLFVAGANLQMSLREDFGRSGESGGRRFVRGFLAVAEVALAMIVLVGAGLLVRSFLSLTRVNPGFDVQNLARVDVQLPQFEYSNPNEWRAFSDELLGRLQAQPGMQDTAIAVPLPLASGFINLAFDIVGNPPLPPGAVQEADYVAISPNYFRVLRIPLLRGRWFSVGDRDQAPQVTIISEALAHQYFPNQDPIGRQLSFEFPPRGATKREIVGIVGDVHDTGLNQPAGAMMYVPFAQAPFWGAEIVVKSNLGAASIATTVRQQVHAIDRDVPISDVESMTEAIHASVEQPRFRTMLLGLFGAIALVLAAAGIFGVMSYSVSRRTHEIGVRMALGASSRSVLRLVLAESATLVAIGLAVGIPAGLALTRLLSNMLFAVRPSDPLTFLAVATLLIAVALGASYFPTRRAMRVDPLVALRHE
jgi:putative ABC transport system permease protein